MLILSAMALAVSFLVSVSMVVALNLRIIRKVSRQKCPDRIVRISCHASVKPDPCFRQRNLGAVADPSADQHLHI